MIENESEICGRKSREKERDRVTFSDGEKINEKEKDNENADHSTDINE